MTSENRTDIEVIGDLVVAFHNDYDIRAACRYAKISPDTYYRWLKEKEGFAEQMEDAQNKLLAVAGEYINQFFADKDTPVGDKAKMALQFKTKRDPRYKNTVAHEFDPTANTLEDKMREFLDDEANKPDNLPDNSEETDTEDTQEA